MRKLILTAASVATLFIISDVYGTIRDRMTNIETFKVGKSIGVVGNLSGEQETPMMPFTGKVVGLQARLGISTIVPAITVVDQDNFNYFGVQDQFHFSKWLVGANKAFALLESNAWGSNKGLPFVKRLDKDSTSTLLQCGSLELTLFTVTSGKYGDAFVLEVPDVLLEWYTGTPVIYNNKNYIAFGPGVNVTQLIDAINTSFSDLAAAAKPASTAKALFEDQRYQRRKFK